MIVALVIQNSTELWLSAHLVRYLVQKSLEPTVKQQVPAISKLFVPFWGFLLDNRRKPAAAMSINHRKRLLKSLLNFVKSLVQRLRVVFQWTLKIVRVCKDLLLEQRKFRHRGL